MVATLAEGVVPLLNAIVGVIIVPFSTLRWICSRVCLQLLDTGSYSVENTKIGLC